MAILGTAYFLLATSDPHPHPPPMTVVCVDGLESSSLAVSLAPVASSQEFPESCGGYDGLTGSSRLEVVLAATTDATTTDPATTDAAETTCVTYDAALVALPPALSDATVVSASSGSGGVFSVAYELELPSEPGCRFQYFIDLRPRDTVAENAAGEERFDATTTPLVLVRTISFPQVQLCGGAADAEVRGWHLCGDLWEASLEQP